MYNIISEISIKRVNQVTTMNAISGNFYRRQGCQLSGIGEDCPRIRSACSTSKNALNPVQDNPTFQYGTPCTVRRNVRSLRFRKHHEKRFKDTDFEFLLNYNGICLQLFLEPVEYSTRQMNTRLDSEKTKTRSVRPR